jgi:hypothetical protein
MPRRALRRFSATVVRVIPTRFCTVLAAHRSWNWLFALLNACTNFTIQDTVLCTYRVPLWWGKCHSSRRHAEARRPGEEWPARHRKHIRSCVPRKRENAWIWAGLCTKGDIPSIDAMDKSRKVAQCLPHISGHTSRTHCKLRHKCVSIPCHERISDCRGSAHLVLDLPMRTSEAWQTSLFSKPTMTGNESGDDLRVPSTFR